MPRNTVEVDVGVGTLYTAPEGTARPANPEAAVGVGWTEIGYSDEGWTINVDRTLENIEVEEELDPIDIAQTAREAHVIGAAAQVTLDNIKLAFGGGEIDTSDPDYPRYTPGATDDLDRVALLFRTDFSGRPRDWYFPHAVSASAVDITHRKAPQKRLVAMDFRVVKDTADELFELIDTAGS